MRPLRYGAAAGGGIDRSHGLAAGRARNSRLRSAAGVLDKAPASVAVPRVDALHRRAGHTHLHSTFFLRHAQVIHEADALT